jgi:hypothetical protein
MIPFDSSHMTIQLSLFLMSRISQNVEPNTVTPIRTDIGRDHSYAEHIKAVTADYDFTLENVALAVGCLV